MLMDARRRPHSEGFATEQLESSVLNKSPPSTSRQRLGGLGEGPLFVKSSTNSWRIHGEFIRAFSNPSHLLVQLQIDCQNTFAVAMQKRGDLECEQQGPNRSECQ
jgi:hypothetical protein